MALAVVIMLPTMFDIFVYALPAFAALITIFCVIELNKKWALGVYAGAAIISVLIVPNKEAAILYAAFFGYYPILKAIFESKIKSRVLEYILKFLVFNVSVIISYAILVKVMGMPFDKLMGITDKESLLGRYGVPLFLALGNFAFIVLDFYYGFMATLYVKRMQKIFRKMFRLKR